MKNKIFQPIGMRNIKTALAVFICLLLYLLFVFLYGLLPEEDSTLLRFLDFLLNRNNAIFACIAAIISMQPSVEDSFLLSKSRLIGTAVGGVIGIGVLMLVPFRDHTIFSYLLFSLGIVMNIYICNIIRNTAASAIACITFLIIVLSIDSGDSAVPFAINRMIDTAIGIIVSIPVNCLIKAPKNLSITSPENNTAVGKDDLKELKQNELDHLETGNLYNMKEITYRKAVENDIETLIQMRIQQLQEEGAEANFDLGPNLQAFYKKHLTDDTFIAWVAVMEGRIIATSGMSFEEKPPYYGNPSGKIGLLSSVYTLAEYRRRGIARALLGKVVEEVRQYGCGTIQLTASDMGTLLYSDFGFQRNNNFMQYIL